MFYIYILRDSNNKLYVGYSKNLRRRLAEHKRKNVYATKRLINPELVYYEAYLDKGSAKEREEKLKNYGSSYHGLLKRLKIK